jgi:hypothetical protein
VPDCLLAGGVVVVESGGVLEELKKKFKVNIYLLDTFSFNIIVRVFDLDKVNCSMTLSSDFSRQF